MLGNGNKTGRVSHALNLRNEYSAQFFHSIGNDVSTNQFLRSIGSINLGCATRTSEEVADFAKHMNSENAKGYKIFVVSSCDHVPRLIRDYGILEQEVFSKIFFACASIPYSDSGLMGLEIWER